MQRFGQMKAYLTPISADSTTQELRQQLQASVPEEERYSVVMNQCGRHLDSLGGEW